MDRNETLRDIVAKISGAEANSIDSAFSLETSALKGSLKRAALAAAIRRHLGLNCPAAHAVATFGELEQAVFGETTSPTTPAPPALPRETPSFGAPLFNNGASEIRCGIDIESIADLPEAADYREHEFYKDSFSPEEIAYCVLQENPRMHFAARWCGKEALIKCDSAFRDEKMSDLEITRNERGEVFLRHRRNGNTHVLPHAISLSHTNSFATAMVVKVAGRPAQMLEDPEVTPPSDVSEIVLPTGTSSRLVWIVASVLAMGVAVLAVLRILH
jgi:phosphopantetheine--protein transferase-like protein